MDLDFIIIKSGESYCFFFFIIEVYILCSIILISLKVLRWYPNVDILISSYLHS